MILSFERRHCAGHQLYPMGSAKAVDNSGQNQAALMNAQLSKEQLEWAKEIYGSTADERATTTRISTDLAQSQLDASKQQNVIAAQSWDDYQKTYRPLEVAMAQEAATYDTPERRAAAAAAATSDVERNVAAQRGATIREMERAGVNPASGKAMALQGSMDLGASKLKAGASTQAMRNVEMIGAAKKADAVNLGRGIASSQATNAALAMQQGNSGAANSTNALNAASSGVNGVQQGYAGAQAGFGNAASIYGNIAQQQQSANNAATSSTNAAIGGAAAIAASTSSYWMPALMAMSDKTKKTDITPVDPEEVLDAVAATPVSEWKYKSGAVAGDHGQRRIGPMAQDVGANLGNKVAPGGKQIDLVSANGIAMAAIQGLNLKVDKLAASISKSRGRAMALEA